MVWLGAYYNSVTPPVVIKKGSINHERYIDEILPITLKDGRKLIGDEFKFEQDRAAAHSDHHTQAWCKDHFWAFCRNYDDLPNSSDLNLFNYSLWYELCSQINWNKVKNKNIG
jgi:hypothetical protein